MAGPPVPVLGCERELRWLARPGCLHTPSAGAPPWAPSFLRASRLDGQAGKRERPENSTHSLAPQPLTMEAPTGYPFSHRQGPGARGCGRHRRGGDVLRFKILVDKAPQGRAVSMWQPRERRSDISSHKR